MSNINDNYAMNGLPENPIDQLIAEVEQLEKELQETKAQLEKAEKEIVELKKNLKIGLSMKTRHKQGE